MPKIFQREENEIFSLVFISMQEKLTLHAIVDVILNSELI